MMKEILTKVGLLLLTVVALVSCKEDNWIDWKLQNELWLEQNMLNDPEIKMTEDSLQYKIIYPGNIYDVRPQQGSTVVCDYTGRLINGYQFDKSANASFTLISPGIIEGWVKGLPLVHNCGDIILYIPWKLGYGEEGNGTEGTSGYIPPYSTLIFEVHVSSVQ